MTPETTEKLRLQLSAFAERQASAKPVAKTGDGVAERKRRACADTLRTVVRPVLEEFAVALQNAGHDATTRDHTDLDDAYPSVALSLTPRVHAARSPESVLASALMFKYDPRRGILVHRDVKLSPAKGRVTPVSGDRTGTIGVDAVSAQWVETKTLSFVEDVLKAN
jgi:hypothetical protein